MKKRNGKKRKQKTKRKINRPYFPVTSNFRAKLFPFFSLVQIAIFCLTQAVLSSLPKNCSIGFGGFNKYCTNSYKNFKWQKSMNRVCWNRPWFSFLVAAAVFLFCMAIAPNSMFHQSQIAGVSVRPLQSSWPFTSIHQLLPCTWPNDRRLGPLVVRNGEADFRKLDRWHSLASRCRLLHNASSLHKVYGNQGRVSILLNLHFLKNFVYVYRYQWQATRCL